MTSYVAGGISKPALSAQERASDGTTRYTRSSINCGSVNTVASRPVSWFTAYLRNMLSAWIGSLPFRKTSLTRFGQSAVGSIPEGSQTLMTETSAGTAQLSGGTFCEAICINAFHRTAAALDPP